MQILIQVVITRDVQTRVQLIGTIRQHMMMDRAITLEKLDVWMKQPLITMLNPS